METISVRDVRQMARRYERAARIAGLIADSERVHLQEGSPTYGRAWRVFISPAGTYAHHNAPAIGAAGWIGNSKRDAYNTLAAIATAIEATTQHSGAAVMDYSAADALCTVGQPIDA